MKSFRDIKQQKESAPGHYAQCKEQLAELIGLANEILENGSNRELFELSGWLEAAFECLTEHSLIERCSHCQEFGLSTNMVRVVDLYCACCAPEEFEAERRASRAEDYSNLQIKALREAA